MQDFAMFCNAKIDFFGGSGLKPAPNNLELKSRVVQLIKQGSDKSDAVRLVASISL
jgi:hypothetical protein